MNPLCFKSFTICVHLSEYFLCVHVWEKISLNTFANNILKENYRIADLGRQLFRCRWIYSQCALIREPEERKKERQ